MGVCVTVKHVNAVEWASNKLLSTIYSSFKMNGALALTIKMETTNKELTSVSPLTLGRHRSNVQSGNEANPSVAM